MKNYRSSHLSPLHAEQYAHSFSDETTYRGMVWRLEKDILTKIVTDIQWKGHIEHLDFACGTGRILSHLSRYTNRSMGVDVSPSMLKFARAANSDADIFEADLTRHNVLEGCKFNLITAFRFFPNAEPDLRNEAIQVLSNLLSRDGYLIFNNHRNLGSTDNRLRRMIGHGGYEGMSMFQALAMTREAGLKITAVHHLCVLMTAEESSLLPPSLLFPMERVMSRIRFFRGLAQEHVFVCRKR